MAAVFTLTVRDGPRVSRSRFGTLTAALDALDAAVDELSKRAARPTVDLRVRRFEPGQQVAARAEIRGPGRLFAATRGGVDLRGDGSAEAYIGRARRELVQQRRGETATAALRRALGEQR